MRTKRGMALLGARALAGSVGLAALAAVLAGATVLPWPTLQRGPASVVVDPVPTEQQRVCPGPLLTLAEDSSQAQSVTSVGPAEASFGANGATDGSDWIRPSSAELAAPDNANAGRDGAPLLLRVPVQDGALSAPLVAGGQVQVAAEESIAGLAASACAEALSESWLVGGSTDVGSTSLVLLSNPTTVLATVDLMVFGEAGPVDAPGSTGILVQPGTQRVVSLAGLAPNLRAPVVHVTAQGGQVTASLQESSVRGLEPTGVELIGPTAGPDIGQTIAGLIVTQAATPAATDSDGLGDDTPVIRLLVPGDTAATVEVGVTGESAAPGGTSVQVEVQPGIATEVPLTGLAPGGYTVELNSDQPIVAAAHTAGIGAAGLDFAWFTASAPLTDDFLVAVAAGPAPALHLLNAGREDATYIATPEDGEPITVDVPEGESAAVPLAASGRYLVTGGTSTVASVGYSEAGLLSSYALNQAGPLAAPIRVYPR